MIRYFVSTYTSIFECLKFKLRFPFSYSFNIPNMINMLMCVEHKIDAQILVSYICSHSFQFTPSIIFII